MIEVVVPASGSEIRQPGYPRVPEAQQVPPQVRLRLCVEDVQLEPREPLEPLPVAQGVHDGEGGDLPQRGLRPWSGKRQLVLAVLDREVVRRKLVGRKPGEEVRPEHPGLSVEGVAGQPDQLGFRDAEAARMIELRAQLLLGDHVGQPDGRRPVDQREGDGYRPVVEPDELQHQELVEVRVEQGPDDGVDPVGVIVGTRGEVKHRRGLRQVSVAAFDQQPRPPSRRILLRLSQRLGMPGRCPQRLRASIAVTVLSTMPGPSNMTETHAPKRYAAA